MNNTILLEKANALKKGTLMAFFNIEFTAISGSTLTAQMPVNECTCQPNGVLHGGASAALAESTGSMASLLLVAQENERILGIDIHLNHIKPVPMGKMVFATATLLHKGKTLQHWDIKITDEQKKLVAYGKHTTIIVKQQ